MMRIFRKSYALNDTETQYKWTTYTEQDVGEQCLNNLARGQKRREKIRITHETISSKARDTEHRTPAELGLKVA
jgi:hypothetical protein